MGVVRAPTRIRSGHRGSGMLPLLPFFTFTGFFLIWPVIAVTLRSFKGNKNEWTFANYRPILHSGPYLHAFMVSLKLSLITAVIGSLLGAYFAYVIVKYAHGKFGSVIDSSSAVFANSGGVPLAFMFVAAFGTEGIVTTVLKNLGWDIYASNRRTAV